MAITKCKECGNEISTQAKACPKCGFIIKKKNGCLNYLAVSFLFVVVVSVFGLFSSEDKEKSMNNEGPPITQSEKEIESKSGPLCTHDEMWIYVVNNAYRTADEYATSKNPNSTFISIKNKQEYTFVKQYGGEYKDGYLMIITNKQYNGISLAVLSPLFDVNKPSKELDDTKPLWRVVTAKFNGTEY